MNFFLTFLGLIAVINISLALFVFSRSPNSWINRSFVLFVGTLSIWTVCIGMLFTLKTLLWSDLTLFFGNLLGVGSFILFAKHFPESQKLNKPYLIYFYLLPAVIFILLTPFHPFISGVIVKNGQIQPEIGPLYPLLILWSIFGFLFGSYIIFKKYRKSFGRPKEQLRYLFLGFFFFLFIVTLTGVILPAFGVGNLGFFSPAATLIMVGFISYAIIRHRLLDLRLIVARSVAYSLIIVLFATLYGGGLFIVSQLITGTAFVMNQVLTSILFALIMAFSFQPLKRFFEVSTSRIFYRDAYNSNALLGSLSRIMASRLILSDLVDDILKQLLSEMKILSGQVLLFKRGSLIWSKGQNTKTMGFGHKEVSTVINSIVEVDGENILIFEELPETELKELMRKYDISVILPLVVKNEIIGAMLLGGKSSGDIYSSVDIDLLKIFAPEAAVAIKNSLSYEEIKRFNITLEEEVKSATSKLERANTRLKELDHLKDEFVSVASHELRTPMTAIKSYLWMALNGRGGDLNEKQVYYLDRAYMSTDRLIKLVNDMLNVSRIEAGRVSLDVKKVDMLNLTDEVIGEVKPRADELGLNIKVQKAENLPEVIADVDKVKEVMINLIGNSLKFTPKDGIISISYEVKDGFVVTHVKDTGKGVEKDDLPKLFQKFGLLKGSYQTNQTASQGTGLGLYICKSIMQLHRGDIWAESEGRDKGSIFSFSLKAYNKKELEEIQKDQQGKEGIDIIHTGIN